VEAAPGAEPDEDHVADRGRDEARDQHRERRGAHRDAALDHHHPAHDRAVEERRDRGERAGGGKNGLFPLAERAGKRHYHPDDRAERDQRRLRAEHGLAECAGQAVPQPVLEVVHHREEERGEKRRRDPDHRSERD
jgi:hypothetical protein